jgi:hypothetical protein
MQSEEMPGNLIILIFVVLTLIYNWNFRQVEDFGGKEK